MLVINRKHLKKYQTIGAGYRKKPDSICQVIVDNQKWKQMSVSFVANVIWKITIITVIIREFFFFLEKFEIACIILSLNIKHANSFIVSLFSIAFSNESYYK